MSIREMVIAFEVVGGILAILAILYVLVDWLLENKPFYTSHKESKKRTTLAAAVACVSTVAGAAIAMVALKNHSKKADKRDTASRLQKSKPIKAGSRHGARRNKKRY